MTTIYSKAGTDAAISGAVAAIPVPDLSGLDVDQIALAGNLALTVPAGYPVGQVYRVVFTQDETGGHTVTYGGSPVNVDTTAGALTLVEVWPSGAVVYPGRGVPVADAPVVAVLGDSLVELTTWTGLLAEATGGTVHKLGIGGARLSTSSSSADYNALSVSSIATAIASGDWIQAEAAAASLVATGDDNRAIVAAMMALDWQAVDWVLILAGTNDWGASTLVGTRGDTGTTTVRGATRHIIATLQAALPGARLGFITPPFRARTNYADGRDSDGYPNANGEWLWEHADAILGESARCHIPALDAYRASGINAWTATTYLSDGLHLNVAGDALLARLVGGFLGAPTSPPPAAIRFVGGTYNIGIGDSVHTVPPVGDFNIAIGSNAQKNLTSGSYNTAGGLNSAQNLTEGGDNTMMGYSAGRSVTNGDSGVYIGSGAGYYGAGSVANATTTANGQVVIGYRAGLASPTQFDNIVAIGQSAGVKGVRGVAVGSVALASHVDSVALGANTVTTADKQLQLGPRHIEIAEVASDPSVAPANGVRLYAKDDGAGKTQLVVAFASGSVQVLATQP